FVRARSGQVDRDIYRCRVNLGKQIDAQGTKRENSQRYQKCDQHDREDGPLDANLCDLHWASLAVSMDDWRSRISLTQIVIRVPAPRRTELYRRVPSRFALPRANPPLLLHPRPAVFCSSPPGLS